MIDITKSWDKILLKDTNKKEIVFDTNSLDVAVDWLSVSFPGEYEKAGILAEVREFDSNLFYSFTIDSKHVFIVPTDKLEIKEDILSFFWDIDVLIILWTKDAVKVFENLEAKLVIPYGEQKDLFLWALWQHIEQVESYKLKWDLDWDRTEFVNLA